jgi:hypothetical protein
MGPNIHTPERLADESFEDYKKRRKESKLAVKKMRNPAYAPWPLTPNPLVLLSNKLMAKLFSRV